ncbi:MAG: hypothetical protein FJ297_10245 [Planctomycetes bacterium]|nr:hypothetical protein [Planctomycetota bacterium]
MPGPQLKLSATTRKAIAVQIGEPAGQELVGLVMELARRVEELERTKVSIMAVAPVDSENMNDRFARRRAA